MIKRGNHKYSDSEMNSSALDKAISKEVNHIWSLPLTILSLKDINNARVFPMGGVGKLSINEMREHYIKQHFTHYCTFPCTLGPSVNNHVQRESLQPRFHGLFLLRIIHMISAI